MSVCGGTNCSKRNRCKHWTGNMKPNQEDYYLDWSTMGWGGISNYGNDDHGWYCGDYSKSYPNFQEMRENEFPLRFSVYIIESKNPFEEDKYHAGHGEMTDKILESEFYSSDTLAEQELSYFDEPELFEIKELHIAIDE